MAQPGKNDSNEADEEAEDPGALLDSELGLEILTDSDGVNSMRMEGTSVVVVKAFSAAVRDGEFRRGAKRAFADLRHALPADLRDAEEFGRSGREAAELLETIIRQLTMSGEALFGRALPAYDWLWMIRRLPLAYIWASAIAATTRAVMSNLALARNTTLTAVPPDGIIEVTPRHGRRLAFLVGYASVLAQLTGYYRLVGKGALLSMRPQLARMSARLSDTRAYERVLEYDRRVEEEGAWGGFGIHLQELHRRALDEPPSETGRIGLVFQLNKPRWNDRVKHGGPTLERYGERFVSLGEVFDVLTDQDAPSALQLDPDLAPLLCLTATYALARRAGTVMEESIMRVGYSLHHIGESNIAETHLGEEMRMAIEWAKPNLPLGATPDSVSDLWALLNSIKPSVWPLRLGPVIIPIGKRALAIDWHAASMRLLHALRYPRVDGETANLRARAFEISVRRAVDRTSFSPEPWLKDLLGRHLRLQGMREAFGEIDAAASLSDYNIHLVISCKSYPYTEAYERGDHREVRNVSDKLAVDARAVAKMCLTMKENRSGANYEVPGGAYLVPVLVTPRVMWSDDQLCWERLLSTDGPPLACGMGELVEYLNRIGPPAAPSSLAPESE